MILNLNSCVKIRVVAPLIFIHIIILHYHSPKFHCSTIIKYLILIIYIEIQGIYVRELVLFPDIVNSSFFLIMSTRKPS